MGASIAGTSDSRPLIDRRFLFFGGKGGVGKTTVAAAFSVMAAQRGLRTLLVSTDPAPSTSDVLETQLASAPKAVAEHLWAMEIDPAQEADRYIAEVRRNIEHSTPPRLAAEVRRQIDIARVSPGAEEAALFERLARLLEEEAVGFDRVCFDTAPTGHTLHLLTLPEVMSSWVGGLISRRKKYNVLGRMWRNVAGAAAGEAIEPADPVLDALNARRQRFERARRVLTDPEQTAFVFVLTPERLPILETARAWNILRQYRIPVGAVIVNRVIPNAADGEFVAQRRARERQYLDTIAAEFAGLPIYEIPLLTGDVVGLAAIQEIIGHLPRHEMALDG